MENRQERYWLCDLYPDNENHNRAIKIALLSPNTIIMCHNRSINIDTGEILKPHYHIIFVFDKGYYLWSLIDKYGLDREKDAHLFSNLKQYNFKRINDYIVYLTHFNTDKPDKYPPSLFQGGLKTKAINIVEKYLFPNDVTALKVLNEIEYIYLHKHINKYNKELYAELYNKFGAIVYNKWTFFLSFINDYRKIDIDI